MTDAAIGQARGSELTGKVALVTGGARNIGRAIALSLAAGGASVMVNTNKSEALARETVALAEAAGNHRRQPPCRRNGRDSRNSYGRGDGGALRPS